VSEAKRAAQLNLDHAYPKARFDGAKKRQGKVWVSLSHIPKPRDASRLPILEEEQEILSRFIGNWEIENTAIGVSLVAGLSVSQ
jgi:hypothetical protein